ncbi:hypothetical protein [Synechococcus sp. PCC 7336]|uniref:hypothetical protein n=1 Tax=Synechococcus sp. PCC 7336 TaxID=195250 RepID=UPI000345FA44|nr:hypothetical protein [Synechococcus sp. PCC 7336]
MATPSIEAPNLLMFAETARVLQQTSRSLVEQGRESVDLPGLMTEAIAKAEQRLEELDLPRSPQLRQTIRSVLQLSSPDDVLALLQRLIGIAGGDVEAFLERSDAGVTGVLLPRELLYSQVLELLAQRLTETQLEEIAAGGKGAIATEVERLNDEIAAVARDRHIDIEPLQATARKQLRPCDTAELLQLLETLVIEIDRQQEAQDLARAAARAKDSITLAGPLLFTEISQYLLGAPNSALSPDRRLDLQTNQAKALAKLAAMERLGKVDNPEAQKQLIRELIARSSPEELLNILETCFVADDSGDRPLE